MHCLRHQRGVFLAQRGEYLNEAAAFRPYMHATVRDTTRDGEAIAGAEVMRFISDLKVNRAFQYIGDLLVWMAM